MFLAKGPHAKLIQTASSDEPFVYNSLYWNNVLKLSSLERLARKVATQDLPGLWCIWATWAIWTNPAKSKNCWGSSSVPEGLPIMFEGSELIPNTANLKKERKKERWKRNPRFSHWKRILEYLIQLWLPDKIGLYKDIIK